MTKSILTLAALAVGLAWASPARADDELEDRVARLEKLMKRLEAKLDQLGGGKEEKEDVRVEKRLFHVPVPGPEGGEEGPRRMFLFRLEDEDGGAPEKDVIVPRFRRHEELEVLPFPGHRVLKLKTDGHEVEIELVIDGKRYAGTLRPTEEKEKKGEEPRKFEKRIELRERLEEAAEPRLERAREALERARQEFERARRAAPVDPLEAEIERVKDLLDRLLEAKEGRQEKKEKKEEGKKEKQRY